MAYRKSHVPDLASVLAVVTQQAKAEARAAVKDYATEQRDAFRQRIKRQDFDSFHVVFYPDSGTNLSPRWLARKAAKGADERTAIATGTYIASLQVFTSVDSHDRFNVRVGFRPDARARDLDGKVQDVTLNRVARVLENGSQKMHIPPRPHWELHLADMRRNAAKTAKKIEKRVTARLVKALPDYVVKRK